MTTVLAIDPGTTKSAWVQMLDDHIHFAIEDNERLLERMRESVRDTSTIVVIEQVASYGMAVGAEIFETVYWSGRFAEAAHPLPVDRLTRLQVKSHLCHSGKANDSNIRAALIDRYGGTAAIRKGGALYGVSKDVWAALAVAVTWADTHEEETP